jgi:hypothetical protein
VDVGYERFLGPEVFFSPEIFDGNFTQSLPALVDATIQACPIDTRRGLYNVWLPLTPTDPTPCLVVCSRVFCSHVCVM